MSKPQSFENHIRLVPWYHGFVFPVLLLNFLWAARGLYVQPSVGAGLAVLTAAALIALALFARVFALKAQDRVIRLEMQLRLAQLLPAETRGRVADFSIDQLIALRFACDAELPELAATVLRDNVHDKKTIKKMIKTWKADHERV